MENFELLISAILEGDHKVAVAETHRLLGEHVCRTEMVTQCLEEAMIRLDNKCTSEQFNLLEIMLAGRTVTQVMKVLFPTGISPTSKKGIIICAALEGDVHDLGKNIVKTVLRARGYEVIDLGKDVRLDQILDSVKEYQATAVSISGLVTTVIPLLRKLKELLVEAGEGEVLVLAGGAALKQSASDKLNVDFVGDSVFDAEHYLNKMEA